MVKPALPYLDIIADAAQLAPDHPLACYQVSGEFAMVHAGAAAGVYDLQTMAFETVDSMIRAGMHAFYLLACNDFCLTLSVLTHRCNADIDVLYSDVSRLA